MNTAVDLSARDSVFPDEADIDKALALRLFELRAITRASLSIDTAQWLASHGVNWASVTGALGGVIIEARARLRQSALLGGLTELALELDENGEPLVIIPATELIKGDLAPVDFVGWNRLAPHRFGLFMGDADLLGRDQLENPATFAHGGALSVWRTPWAWLRVGCRGCVPLTRAGFRRLAEAPRVIAQDIDHADQIHRAAFHGRREARASRVFIRETSL